MGFPVFYEENHQIPMRSMDVNDVNERFPVLMIPVSKITGGFIKSGRPSVLTALQLLKVTEPREVNIWRENGHLGCL